MITSIMLPMTTTTTKMQVAVCQPIYSMAITPKNFTLNHYGFRFAHVGHKGHFINNQLANQ